MNGLKTLICFGLFFVGFFTAEVLRFDWFVYSGDHSAGTILILLAVAAASGIALALGLANLDLFSKHSLKKVIYGSAFGVLVFFVLFGIEDALSSRKLYSQPEARSFSEVKGHCGVYPGRALIKMYHWDWNPSLRGLLEDFEMANRCRIDRFLELSRKNQIECRAEENPVQCLVRWMPVFAERGYWNADVRRMFLDQTILRSREAKIESSSMIEYALKDYELDAGRPSLLKQAGLEEEFSDDYLYYKQKDELQNVMLTREVFASAAAALQSEPTVRIEPPLTMKFKDTLKEVSFKTEKIPDLQKDLTELKKRL